MTAGEGVGTDQTIMVGQAAARVASVTAVLSDGHTYPGTVTTGRGLPGVVWAVGYPWTAGASFTRGAHLVFRDASGQQVAVLNPHAPVGPPQAAAGRLPAEWRGWCYGGQRGGPGGQGGPSQAGTAQAARPAPPGRDDYLIQQDPPVSQVVSVKVGTQEQARWVYVWFARMKGGQGTVLCSEIRTGKILSAAYCETVQLSADQGAVLTGGGGGIQLGASVKQADSVLAQLPGHGAAGQLISGRGFPAKVWLVSYQSTGSVTIVFRDATGHQVGRLALAGANPLHTRPRHGGLTVFRNQTGTATAYLIAGRVCIWSTATPQVIFVLQASGPPALTVLYGFPGNGSARSSEFYGYAHGNVARVTLRLASGKLLTARTFPGWPGSGIRLWAVPGPASAAMPPKYVALAYDDAGHIVGQTTSGLSSGN